MNPTFQCGYQAAKIWHRHGLEFKYSHPRDDYELGWNAYVANRESWRTIRATALKCAVVLFIAILIYVLLLLT